MLRPIAVIRSTPRPWHRPQPHRDLRRAAVGGLAVALVLGMAALAGAAQEDDKDRTRPERGISIYTDYSGVVVGRDEPVRMDLTVDNKGRRDEDVHLKLTAVPKGWTAQLKSGVFTVTGVPVAAGKTRTVSFSAEPTKGLRAGSYVFQIDAVTADGALKDTQQITVTTRERGGGAGDLQITTSYPVLRGQSDARFEFSLDVNNKADKDRTVNLAVQLPEKWEGNFKPSFESKYITSLVIPANQSRSVSLELTPPREATAGEYPVTVRVSAGESRAEARLTVVLTGIYKLETRTPTGLLSTEAVTGKPTTVTLLVRNTGSAPNRNITFSSFKPENWKVEFKPEKIDALEPGAFQQVEATITPAAQALVGDYSVTLSANGEKASASSEFRVTVRAPRAWGWIGAGLIVGVIGGLGGLFAWLGRR